MFCGATIKPLKVSKNKIENKIIVSTCFFNKVTLLYTYIDDQYLKGLISNIETFNYKIQKYTSTPDNWVYRVYIDETVLNIQSLMDNIININNNNMLKKTKDIKTNNNIINELDYNYTNIKTNYENHYSSFVFIEKLLNKYIASIIKSTDKKYNNIEIYTYNNPHLQYNLSTSIDTKISGNIATYGTLLRYHALTDPYASVVIMRNCSHNMTPLDMIIQNYWITSTNKEYMEYVDVNYEFINRVQYRKQWYMTLYNNRSNSKSVKAKKIKHFNNRVMAGLIGCKVNGIFNSYKHYIDVFNNLYTKLNNTMLNTKYNKISINKRKYGSKNYTITKKGGGDIFKQDKNDIMYEYGIDESVINFILPDLRKTDYMYNNKNHNTNNNHNTNVNNHSNNMQLHNKTFAVEIINEVKYYNGVCVKCDKPKFMSLINIKTNKEMRNIKRKTKKIHTDTFSIKEKMINVTDTKTTDDTKKYINKCCLSNIYDNYVVQPFKFKHRLNNNTEILYYLEDITSEPFKKLNINTWQIPELLFTVVIISILYLKIYKFNNFNIKTNVKDYDEHKINTYVNKYLQTITKAYNDKNINPIIIYPKHIKLFDYNTKPKTFVFQKLLKPIQHKHDLKFYINKS